MRPVDIVTGCFFLIGTALWHDLDGFDPRFFMYGEEADLCHRARARGWRPIVTPAATIMHLGGASHATAVAKRIQVARSRASMVELHWPPVWRPWGRAMLWLWVANRYAGSRVLRGARPAGRARALDRGVGQPRRLAARLAAGRLRRPGDGRRRDPGPAGLRG